MVRKIKSNWKKFTIILLGCIVLLVVVCYCAKIIRRATYNVWTYDIDNFRSDKSSYMIVADKMIEFYEYEKKANDNLEQTYVHLALHDSWTVRCVNSSNSIGSYYDIEIDITEEEREAYKIVSSNLMGGYHGEASTVKVLEDRVIFISGGRPHYVIYMRNGGVPKGLSPNSDFDDDYYREWLTLKWYYIAR